MYSFKFIFAKLRLRSLLGEDSRRRIGGVIFSLMGQMLPLGLGLWTIPQLLDQAGSDRVGFLTISWALIGYFSLFDFGISRALTKRLVEVDFLNDFSAAQRAISTAASLLAVTCGLALIVGIVGWRIWLGLQENISGLTGEIGVALPWIAMAVPLAILSTAQLAILEAAFLFRAAALVRVLLGIVTFAGPLVAVEMGYGLGGVIFAIFLGRIVSFVVALIFCTRCRSFSISFAAVSIIEAKKILGFGGWLTVSNIVGPLMLYSDRFVLASMVALSSVTYYTIPFETFTKVLIIPSAILVVAFPSFAASFRTGERGVIQAYRQFLFGTGLIVGAVVLIMIVTAGPFLNWWLGSDFAIQSLSVSRLLLAGVFVNSIALVAQALVQASGRPDLTAKLHLIELPIYVFYLLPLVVKFGIVGAAFAWLIRVSLSAVALLFMANRQIRKIPAN